MPADGSVLPGGGGQAGARGPAILSGDTAERGDGGEEEEPVRQPGEHGGGEEESGQPGGV